MSALLSPSRLVIRLSQAGVKRARSLLRNAGIGEAHPQWQARAEICGRCPMCVVDRRHAFCGKPFLKQIERDEAAEGCGCPIIEKAKDPAEHCPRTRSFTPSSKTSPDSCDCVWCTQLRQERP